VNLNARRLNAYGARLAALLGTASTLTMTYAIADRDRAYAAEETVAQAPEEIPENVLITGSLIRGTIAVGVPVVNLSPMDFAQTGSLTTADLFKNFPAATFMSGDTGAVAAARVDRGQKVNIRGLDATNATRGLLMVDGLRVPSSGNGLCAIDPSIIPAVSLDHIDVLVDGASATYGSDAISGVINVILRRNYDGAQTQLRFTNRIGGADRLQASQLWGRTWDGGQITLSYEWSTEKPIKGKEVNFGLDSSPWGYDDRTPMGSTLPATISRGQVPSSAPYSSTINQTLGTGCGYFNVPGNQSGIASSPSLCYAVPHGTGFNFIPGTGGTGPGTLGNPVAPTLNWATFSQNPAYAGPISANPSVGTQNQYNPYQHAWYSPLEDRNGGAITVDQRLTKDISFFGEAYYSNRRSEFLNSSVNNPAANAALSQIVVPTWNPYYPAGTLVGQPGCVGAAATLPTSTCVPTNLRVSYDLSVEMPQMIAGNELADRYQLGLNIALPAQWEGQVSYSETYDSNYDAGYSSPNKNAVSAALGWTIQPFAASGTGPSFGTWTKPSAVPYLNLFCDPYAFQCNSPTTLQYITGVRNNKEQWWINEKNAKADGPLFDLPGGTVKAAIGADYTANRFAYLNEDNSSAANLSVTPLTDALHQNVWAVYTQANIPIFGDNNAIPGFRRLEIEASWRHDQYDTVGGTSNPKVSFNWTPIDDLTIKGAWGSNFRAPGFGETSFIAKSVIQGRNLPTTLQTGQGVVDACSAVGQPLPGPTSGAGKLQANAVAFNNAMAAAGAAGYVATNGCIDKLAIPNIPGFGPVASPGITAGVSGLLHPGGITAQGGLPVSMPLRQYVDYANLGGINGTSLSPELATSWGLGFDYAPTNLLRGLDIQATYYIVKINDALRSFGGGGFNDTFYQDPTLPFVFPEPSDLVNPATGQRYCPDPTITVNGHQVTVPINLIPSACPQWVSGISGILANPKATVLPAAATQVYFINDAVTFNVGWLKMDGIDWQWSYDWDMGNIGAFNVGAIGTYYLHQYQNTLPGTPLSQVTDAFHTTVGSTNALSTGVPTSPLLIYRARLGWSNGPWNVTGFMDYKSHYFSSQGAPPNVNSSCVSTGSAIGGGTFPCAQNNFTNLQPNWISFDLSVGYDTGEDPANDYLKHIGLQMVVQDVLNKHPGYQYILSPFACACNGTQPAFGRQISLIVTKTW
jgi:outer membrane receptor protein involved in Fe transport